MNRDQQARVLLAKLTECESKRGNIYLKGWLGASNVVGFAGEPDEEGRPTWDLYLSERPAPRPQQSLPPLPRRPRGCGNIIDLEAVAAE